MQPESETPSGPDDTDPLLQNKRFPQKLRIGLGVVIIVAILVTEAALVPVMRKKPREKDFDECATAAHYCSVNAKCINTVENYTCSPCNEGYSGDGFNCYDVDECTDSAHNCHFQATCSNIPGSFECECILGYIGDGVSCTDIEYPTITVPASFTFWIATETSIPVAVSWIWTADDNSADFNVTSTHNPGDTFPPGDTTVSYTVTDAVNLMTTNTFVITVAYDTENPTLRVPAGFTHWIAATGTTLPVAVTWSGVTAGDNSDDFIVTSTHDPGDTFPLGDTIVFYTVTDFGGLTATDSFVITVAFNVDECTDKTHTCHLQATCFNVIGSFECQCNLGYVGDGASCSVCPGEPLGMEHFTIPNSAITSSSFHNDEPYHARLNGDGCWMSPRPTLESWIQVDLENVMVVTGIIAQGFEVDFYNFGNSYCISQFRVKTGLSAPPTSYILHEYGTASKLFYVNCGGKPHKTFTSEFPSRVTTRFLRIEPNQCLLNRYTTNSNCALRFEILGCCKYGRYKMWRDQAE